MSSSNKENEQPSTAPRKRTRDDTSVRFSVDQFLADYQDSSLEEFILGIDEAGRGPVIGPMVYTGGIVALKDHDELLAAGVADSKQLTEVNREHSLKRLRQIASFKDFTRVISPDDIADAMTGKSAQSLNTLSHKTAVDIIQEAVLYCKGKLRAVYIDTVGRPEVYENAVKRRFPHLVVTVCPKADSLYPIVSAASIVAKTTRDHAIDDLPVSVGTGYPGDAQASKFIRTHLHKFFGYNSTHHYVRQSWGPVKSLVKRHCVDVTFEKDLEDDGQDVKQPTLSFKPKDIRDSMFQHTLGLTGVDGDDDEIVL